MSSSPNDPVVVVGGGTSGLAFISEFVRHSNRPVVLCEPGEEIASDLSRRFFNAITSQNVWDGPHAVLVEGREAVPYMQARAFGGGSAINGMLTGVPGEANADDETGTPTQDECGPVARSLLTVGGKLASLAWKDGKRLNDVRRVQELIASGRVQWVKSAVDHLLVNQTQVVGVQIGDTALRSSHVVLAAGVFHSLALLHHSGLVNSHSESGMNISDHPCVTLTMHLHRSSPPSVFDASVVVPVQHESEGKSVVVGYERASATEDSMALLSAVLLDPTSRGWMDFSGGQPVAHMNMLSTTEDQVHMRHAVREMFRIASLQPVTAVAASVTGADGASLQDLMSLSDRRLDTWIMNNLSPVSHICGGYEPSEVTGISVVDASHLAHVPHVFPNRIVMQTARKVGAEVGGKLQ